MTTPPPAAAVPLPTLRGPEPDECQILLIRPHGGTINAYVAHLLGVHRSLLFTVENTSITLVRLGHHGSTLVTVNDCHHLYDPVL